MGREKTTRCERAKEPEKPTPGERARGAARASRQPPEKAKEKEVKMQEIEGKLIWTKKELEEYAELPVSVTSLLEHPLPPYALITAQPREGVNIKEVSEVNGHIVALMIRFPNSHEFPSGPPTFGLVKVKVNLRGKALTDSISNIQGKYPFTCMPDIKHGDTVEVVIENSDESFPHTIGVRIDVDEDK